MSVIETSSDWTLCVLYADDGTFEITIGSSSIVLVCVKGLLLSISLTTVTHRKSRSRQNLCAVRSSQSLPDSLGLSNPLAYFQHPFMILRQRLIGWQVCWIAPSAAKHTHTHIPPAHTLSLYWNYESSFIPSLALTVVTALASTFAFLASLLWHTDKWFHYVAVMVANQSQTFYEWKYRLVLLLMKRESGQRCSVNPRKQQASSIISIAFGKGNRFIV